MKKRIEVDFIKHEVRVFPATGGCDVFAVSKMKSLIPTKWEVIGTAAESSIDFDLITIFEEDAFIEHVSFDRTTGDKEKRQYFKSIGMNNVKLKDHEISEG